MSDQYITSVDYQEAARLLESDVMRPLFAELDREADKFHKEIDKCRKDPYHENLVKIVSAMVGLDIITKVRGMSATLKKRIR